MNKPKSIEIRKARVHNLKNIDVNIPLGNIGEGAGYSATPYAWESGYKKHL